MTPHKTLVGFSALIVLALLSAAIFFASGARASFAQGFNPAGASPRMADASTSAPAPLPLSPELSQPAQPAALSPTLSYYFISGNTFTPDSSVSYFRQVIGCVNQMPLNVAFSAPVHLPNGSQVVSITLYSYNSEVSATTGTAMFILNDGKGNGGYTVSATNLSSPADYQQNKSTQNNPLTIDNQNYNYFVQWRKSGAVDSPILSLCGVRVEYYAPLGVAAYLPSVSR